MPTGRSCTTTPSPTIADFVSYAAKLVEPRSSTGGYALVHNHLSPTRLSSQHHSVAFLSLFHAMFGIVVYVRCIWIVDACLLGFIRIRRWKYTSTFDYEVEVWVGKRKYLWTIWVSS